MSPSREEKVRQARRALGRDVGQADYYASASPPRPRPVEPPNIQPLPVGQGVPVLTFADVAQALDIPKAQVVAMANAGELATRPVGDWGARFVPRSEVERLMAKRG